MMHKILLMTVLSVAWTCVSCSENQEVSVSKSEVLEISTFNGTWEVDFDRTMEASKQSPKYDAAMAEQMPEIIQRMMGIMKIKLTDSEMVYLRGDRETVISFSVTSSNEESVTVSVQQDEVEATIVFSLVSEEFMNFNSSASDDMDFYVWKKSIEE